MQSGWPVEVSGRTLLQMCPLGTSFESTIKGVMTRSMVDALSDLCSPFVKGGNFAFITAIASSLFPQTEYRSLE